MFVDLFDPRTGAPAFRPVFEEMNAIFNAIERPRQRAPRLNVHQDDERVTLSLVAPGVRPEDIEVTLTGRRLDLSIRRESVAPDGFRAVHQERRAWSLERSFELPFDVDDGVQATLVDGVFTLDLPRVPAAKPKRITVNAGPVPAPTTDDSEEAA